MSEAQLNILNYALLALIYLFFARVLWAVWSEVRGPRVGQPTPRQQAGTAAGRGGPAPDPTAVAARPAVAPGPPPKNRAKRGVPTRLVVLQPRVRKGSAYPIGVEVTLGRAPSCSIGLPDDTFASQLHARIFTQNGGAWVEDLGSTNGTHLNGGRVTAPTALVQGDRVQVGNTIFEAQ
ncbi:MAG: FHA domain-containing protein [Ilumatobacteraceae bacterium]|nr:FHA domain-containing protein [Ilumatobacteraceae bacterium]